MAEFPRTQYRQVSRHHDSQLLMGGGNSICTSYIFFFYAGGLKIWVIQKVFVTWRLCVFFLCCLPSAGHHQLAVTTGAEGTEQYSLICTGRSGARDAGDLLGWVQGFRMSAPFLEFCDGGLLALPASWLMPHCLGGKQLRGSALKFCGVNWCHPRVLCSVEKGLLKLLAFMDSARHSFALRDWEWKEASQSLPQPSDPH